MAGSIRQPETVAAVAALIDHTLLKPAATRSDVLREVENAREWRTASICLHPTWVEIAAEALAGSNVPVCTVIGFPHGATTPRALAAETNQARLDGAREFDMVIPYGRARSGDFDSVREHVRAVKEAAGGFVVKAIIELAELDDETARRAAEAALAGGANMLKTSTGFASGGATVESVRLLAEVAGERAGVKAAGGIRSFEEMRAMIDAGATRIGASGTGTILEQAGQYFT
ncbi:MAG: Deoxyribose-phosphate aldolase 2 [Calditrichaeota bacterium]|nr:Deoxyribose-phosphate aldolase 2 [Calditrichota bacterium]